ncbi:NUDIX domain-containing protein [Galbitalea soli]|uniref:NUDIX domain-containing protein n=1 Tax=Galbitalea soli TaxID=1268042 RepID=A0A7C9TSX1_9MICO|nr:NUDIX domain-containing protein [Galbitalea soli]
MLTTTPVLAAGAVCWRIVDGKVRILLVHRTQHKDVSLPKGKVDPGETLPQTAVREIAEETGLMVALGAPLGQVDYQLPSGRDKSVYYWSAEVDGHALESARFTPNDEISGLEWVSISRAKSILSYPHDIEIVETFAERAKADRARTFAIVIARHGKAVPPGIWDGADATRPLMERGSAQAASIALGLAAYRPLKIISSTAARCLATIAPLARVTGLPVKESHAISQDAYERGESDVEAVIGKRVKQKKSVVLCSHGPVIPELIDAIASHTNTPPTRDFLSMGDLATGEYSVFHIATHKPRSGIVAMETHSPSND